MKKALRFTIETQTEDNEIISICHLNERTIALELSDVARKMFKLNRTLFDKINSSTKLLGGSVYRKHIKESKQDFNKLGVKLLNKYTQDDVNIIDLDFSNDIMKKRQNILLKNGKRLSFDPTSLKNKEYPGPLDPQNLTFDDILASTMVCEIEEIELFQGMGIKTFMLKDFMKDAEGLYQVAYRIEINAETKFKDYVEFVLKELEKSSTFLLSYSNSVDSSLNYNSKSFEFKKEFKDSILNQLGINDNIDTINLGTERIKNSEFGQIALNFYNGILLLRSEVNKSLYSQVLKSILPTSKTSPSIIKNTLKNVNSLIETIRREYNMNNQDSKSSRLQIKVSSKKNNVKNFSTDTTERFDIEKETLGYNVFSENQNGLNKFTTSAYRERIGAEQTKYYPSIDIADSTKFMTSRERSAFSSNSNASSFVTPANIVMGKKKITCSRGMTNIDVNEIRKFRVAKSARAIQAQKTNYPAGLRSAQLSQNVMSDFNITIGKSKTPILERGIDIEIDPLQDAKYYVGDSSFFISNNPELIFKNFKNLIKKEDERVFAIVSDAIPSRFLRLTDSINSIKDLQISNKKSKLRGLVSKQMINLEEIPPQVKSMMAPSFQTNPDIDPLQNRESRAIIDETQKNIFLVRALKGFELDEDGFFDLNRPIHVDMKDVSLDGNPLLAKAYNYEIPELGIVKDKFMPTIYNNLLYIRG